MLIIETVPLAVTEGFDAGIVVATCSTPRMDHNREQLKGQQALRVNTKTFLMYNTSTAGTTPKSRGLWLNQMTFYSFTFYFALYFLVSVFPLSQHNNSQMETFQKPFGQIKHHICSNGEVKSYLWLKSPLCTAGAVQADALVHAVIGGKIVAHLVTVTTAFILRSTISATLRLRWLLEEGR